MALPAIKGNQLENFIYSVNPPHELLEDGTPNQKYKE